MRTAYSLESLEQRLACNSDCVEQRFAFGAFYLREREKKMFGRDVLIAEILRFFLGAVEDLRELARKIRLRVALFWVPRSLGFRLLAQRCDADSELLQNGDDNSLVLVQESQEEVK